MKTNQLKCQSDFSHDLNSRVHSLLENSRISWKGKLDGRIIIAVEKSMGENSKFFQRCCYLQTGKV